MPPAARKQKGSSPSVLAVAAAAALAHTLGRGRSGCSALTALSLDRRGGLAPTVIPLLLDLGVRQLGMHHGTHLKLVDLCL